MVATRGVVREFLLLGSVFGKRCSSRDLVRWRADGCRVVRWDSVGYVLCCGVAQGPEKWDTKVAEANEILWGLKLALDEGIDKLVIDDPFSAVTLKYRFGGVFKTISNGEVLYKGGKVRTFSIDLDKLCWWWLEDFAKKCGDYDKIDYLYYLVPGLTLADGLRKMYSDLEVLELRSVVEKYRSIEIYVFDGKEAPHFQPMQKFPIKRCPPKPLMLKDDSNQKDA
uniref:RNase H type-1 domain-containing protein n=1 Tax=Chenopodium quinoa TaxID=63459 RepID=A0A803MVP0_CHEQI